MVHELTVSVIPGSLFRNAVSLSGPLPESVNKNLFFFNKNHAFQAFQQKPWKPKDNLQVVIMNIKFWKILICLILAYSVRGNKNLFIYTVDEAQIGYTLGIFTVEPVLYAIYFATHFIHIITFFPSSYPLNWDFCPYPLEDEA